MEPLTVQNKDIDMAIINVTKIHCVALYDTAVVSSLHTSLFSVEQALQKVFHVTSEFQSLPLDKKFSKISFDEKMVNNGSK